MFPGEMLAWLFFACFSDHLRKCPLYYLVLRDFIKKKYVPFVHDCGYFITDCFIFHKQNTTLKFNFQFFLLRIEKKISVFESLNMGLFLQPKVLKTFFDVPF